MIYIFDMNNEIQKKLNISCFDVTEKIILETPCGVQLPLLVATRN